MRKILLIMIVWLLMGVKCEYPKFERNPALELFLADSSSSYYPNWYFSPIWAPSGEKIYCISRREDPEKERFHHMLLSVRIVDKKIDTLVKDSVMLFTLSNKGDKIAYVKGYMNFYGFENPRQYLNFPLKEIVFIDAITGNVEGVFTPSCPHIFHLKYTHNDSFLIYFGYGDTSIQGFYSLDIFAQKESLILKVPEEILNKTLLYIL